MQRELHIDFMPASMPSRNEDDRGKRVRGRRGWGGGTHFVLGWR